MKRRSRNLLFSLGLAGVVGAQAGDGPELRQSVISGGGASTQGGEFVMHATVGQAATTRSSGPGVQLRSGFWRGVPQDAIFENGFE